MGDMSKEDHDRLRKLVIEMVLGTDMKQHFSIVTQFRTHHQLSTTPKVRLTAIPSPPLPSPPPVLWRT